MAFGLFCVFFFWLWAVGAVRYHSWLPENVGTVLATLMVLWAVVLIFRVERLVLWFSCVGGMATTVWLLSLLQQPSHDREWAKDQTQLAQVQFDGRNVVVQNFRNNKYRSESDFDVHYLDFAFEISQLKKVWLVVQRFTQSEGMAHVFLTFEVSPQRGESKFMAVSVEVRREEGESYSPLKGLYRNYELNYVFGTEEDLLGVRTLMRPNDRVYMHPVNASPEQVQQLFRNIAGRCNQIVERPEFYHSLLNNCMNGVLEHTYELTPEPISWTNPKVVLPGYSGRLAFEKNLIGNGGDFDAFEEQCRVDIVAREYGIHEGFSRALRSKLTFRTPSQ